MLEYKLQIEFARVSDAAEIAALSKSDIERGLGWKYTPAAIARRIADRSRNVVVARLDAGLAGFGIMTYYEDQANLDLLAVKRPYRRMKVGTRIVKWLEEVAVTAGAFNIFVQVRAGNRAAVAFYKRLGFAPVEEIGGYYGGVEAALVLSKTLRPMIGGT